MELDYLYSKIRSKISYYIFKKNSDKLEDNPENKNNRKETNNKHEQEFKHKKNFLEISSGLSFEINPNIFISEKNSNIKNEKHYDFKNELGINKIKNNSLIDVIQPITERADEENTVIKSEPKDEEKDNQMIVNNYSDDGDRNGLRTEENVSTEKIKSNNI